MQVPDEVVEKLKKEREELYRKGFEHGVKILKEITYASLERFATSDLEKYYDIESEDFVTDSGSVILHRLTQVGIEVPETASTFLEGVKDALLEAYRRIREE